MSAAVPPSQPSPPRRAVPPTVLDGGLSTALEQQGADFGDRLWTARLLAEEPARIRSAHLSFFAAGAQVATTASYQASVEGFTAAGLDPEEARRLVRLSVRLAQEAAQEARERAREAGRSDDLLVAASVGPYGAFLADGSEYRGRYGVPAARLRDFHAPRLALLAEAGPDLVAVETVPDVEEAAVLVELLDDLGLPAWLSYAVRGSATCAGQPLDEAFAVLAGSTSLVAAGVNCSEVRDVLGAVRTVREVTDLPAVAYPNRGGTWDAATKTWSGAGGLDLDLLDAWVAAGAAYVGGCCGTGPADVARIAERLAGPPVTP